MNNENAEQREIRTRLTGLVGALFDPTIPFYDKGNMQAAIQTFCNDKEVLSAAVEFTERLENIWKKRFPDKPLSHAKPQNLPVKWEPPEFSQSKGVDNGCTSSIGQTNSIASTSITPDGTSHAPASGNATLTSEPKEVSSTSPATSLNPGQTPSKTMPTPKPPEPRPPTFHLPNCKVGTSYSEKIEGEDANGKPVSVIKLCIPDALSLNFDLKTQTVSGEPKADGEFDLELLWAYQGTAEESRGTCRLISNPDPRTLWKVLEPEKELPYRKPHEDKSLIKGNGFNIAAASRRGRSHEHGGTFRDDDFFVSDDAAKGWSVLIVADGAGSAKSSREGSRLAVAAAGKHMESHLTGEFGDKMTGLLTTWDSEPTATQKTIYDKFYVLFQEAASLAIKDIKQEAQLKNAPAKDYSTTLLAAAVRREGDQTFLATFWMWDGAIAAYGPRGKVRLMGTPDGGEFA